MKTKELICVLCPNGCQLEVRINEGHKLEVDEVRGSLCEKGPEWAEQEILNPVRTIASSVRVKGGDLPLVSVRTDSPIPLGKIFDVMKSIKELEVDAPVHIGDRLIDGPAGTGCSIIATRNVQSI
jgi:CxxC motif-containing protein